MSLRDLILEQDDIPKEEIEIPEWKDPNTGEPLRLLIRGATIGEGFEIMRRRESESQEEATLQVVIRNVLDPNTKQPVFSANDIKALQKKNPAAINRIMTKVAELNKSSDNELKEAQAAFFATPDSASPLN